MVAADQLQAAADHLQFAQLVGNGEVGEDQRHRRLSNTSLMAPIVPETASSEIPRGRCRNEIHRRDPVGNNRDRPARSLDDPADHQ